MLGGNFALKFKIIGKFWEKNIFIMEFQIILSWLIKYLNKYFAN
jgi:hypothetical protein